MGVIPGINPIFISGVYRSGTTFLTALIGNHPNIAAAASTVKYLRICLPNYDLGNSNNLDDLLQETAHRIYRRWSLTLDVSKVREELTKTSVTHALVYNAIMHALLVEEKPGARRWAEKINTNWRDIPKFLEMFPDGSVVHIFRDPRDVSASYKNMTYEPWPTFLDAALNCKAAMIEVPDYVKRYGSDRILIVRAEDLALNLSQELQKIFMFLDEPYDESMLDLDNYVAIKGEDWRTNTSFEVAEKNYTKAKKRWTTALSKEELFFIELFCQPEMAKFKYKGSGQSVAKLDAYKITQILSDEWLSERIKIYLSDGAPEQGYRSDPYETEMKIVFG